MADPVPPDSAPSPRAVRPEGGRTRGDDGGPEARGAEAAADRGPAPHPLRIEPLGVTVAVPAGTTLLGAAAAGGVVLPSSCRNGTCRACRCVATEGRVHYRIPWPGLSPDEKAAGDVLPCVAYPDCPVTLHAPHARRA